MSGHVTLRGPIQSSQNCARQPALVSAWVPKPGLLEATPYHLQMGGHRSTRAKWAEREEGGILPCCFQKRPCGLGWSKQQMVIPDIAEERFQNRADGDPRLPTPHDAQPLASGRVDPGLKVIHGLRRRLES